MYVRGGIIVINNITWRMRFVFEQIHLYFSVVIIEFVICIYFHFSNERANQYIYNIVHATRPSGKDTTERRAR